MRVGIDLAAAAMADRAPGTARLVQELALALFQVEVLWTWVPVFSRADNPLREACKDMQPRTGRYKSFALHASLELGSIWKSAGCQLGYSMAYFTPFHGPPVVANFFDANFYEEVDAWHRRRQWLRHQMTRCLFSHTLRRAGRLFALSNYGRVRMTEKFPQTNEKWVVDAGAATGQFSVAFALTHPGSRIIAFEPSRRQRILIRRNLAINHVAKQCTIEPFGLWSENGTLAFRTHGAISSLELVSELSGRFLFTEKARVIRLDDWARQNQLPRLDLIKMDIEGAEIEAIQGMKNVLVRHRPALLIQAYHIRNGSRTLEHCINELCSLGYACREIASSGLLIAAPVQQTGYDQRIH